MSLASQVTLFAQRVGAEFKSRKPRGFRGWPTTYRSIAANTATLIPLEGSVNDDSSYFAISNATTDPSLAVGLLKILKPGLYSFAWVIHGQNPNGYFESSIRQDSASGQTFGIVGNYATTDSRVNGSKIIRLSGPTNIALVAYSAANSPGINTYFPNTELSVAYLGI